MLQRLTIAALAVGLGGALCLAWWQNGRMRRGAAEQTVLQDQLRTAIAERDDLQRTIEQLKAASESLSTTQRIEAMRWRDLAARMRETQRENQRLRDELDRVAGGAPRPERDPVPPVPTPEVASTPTVSPPPPLPAGVQDLGRVELAEGIPTNVELSPGRDCVVTATRLDDGQLQLEFAYQSEADGVPTITRHAATVAPGQSLSQSIAGTEISLTPVLKAK